jgi:tetratricopeptide (TPR) repeat protein
VKAPFNVVLLQRKFRSGGFMLSDKKLIGAASIILPVLFLVAALAGCNPVVNLTRDGEFYLESGDYYKALDSYTRAINQNPGDSVAYLGRATAYLELGHLDMALDDYNAAVALLPNDAGVYVDRGLARELQGKYQLALEDYTKAIGLNPSNASAYYHCGNAYMELGNTSQAFERYRSAARLGHTEAQNILRSKGLSW